MARYFLVTRDEVQLPQSALTTARRGWISYHGRAHTRETLKARSIKQVLGFGAATGLPYDDRVIDDFLKNGAFIELTEEVAERYKRACRDYRTAGLILGVATPLLFFALCFALSRYLGTEFRAHAFEMIVMAGVCALAGVYFFFRGPTKAFERLLPQPAHANDESETSPEMVSPR